MFGRATIRLGIGPHSSLLSVCLLLIFLCYGPLLPDSIDIFQRDLKAFLFQVSFY